MDVLRYLRDLVTHNLGLKVFALMLAVLIHVVVQRDSVRETDVDVPVALLNVPKGQVFVGNVPETVKVRVRGRWGGIRELLSDRTTKVVVDLGPYRDGERFVFEQEAVEQQLPSRHVEVLGVEPASLAVRLEALEERLVPVEAVVSGEPAPGFRVAPRNLKVEPERVKVSGPSSQVRALKSLRTAPIDLAGTDADLRVTTRLVPPADRHIRIVNDEVAIEVKLEELEIARTMPAILVVVRGCPAASRCMLDPAEVNLRVEGLVRAVHAFMARPPEGIVFADVAAPLQRNERLVRIGVQPVKGLILTPTPGVAKFSLLSEIPPAVGQGR